MSSQKSGTLLLPAPTEFKSPRRRQCSPAGAILLTLAVMCLLNAIGGSNLRRYTYHRSPSFYHHVEKQVGICANSSAVSYSGHIGLHGDTESMPKRSFFWYFEAEENPDDAPIILTMGGGPGTSGMMNPLLGQSHCVATDHGLVSNLNSWAKKHNLIALDHPIGVGFSYGTHVNNSRSAAYDAYDFLQKFFVLFPHLTGNKFVISGGSYGGVYVPNIATVIHEQNLLLESGRGQRGAVPIPLDALIISNPFTSPIAHFTWLLQYRCVEHQIYNTTDCDRLYADLPTCLESVELAFEIPTVANRVRASQLCYQHMNSADMHGVLAEDIRVRCTPVDPTDPTECHPHFRWFSDIFSDPPVRTALGIPPNLNYTPLNMENSTSPLAVPAPHRLGDPPPPYAALLSHKP
ncbi:Alpha/Beta hydrolase protein [Mycena galericulata]|nr:Alpha/Beta hydrolase protein [Mycena galericulata]